MNTDKDWETPSQRALRLEERNARAASTSTEEGEKKQELESAREEAEAALQQEEAKTARAQRELGAIRQQIDRRIAEKEEEFESTRKNHSRAMESMQASFETQARAKEEALKSKKKLEQDIVELESALDNANRGRADADKVIKKLQQQNRDIEASVEAEVKAKDEIREQYAASERRTMAVTGELEDLRTHMEAAERSRKAAESELHEASDRVAELTNANTSLSTQKRKLETDIQAMHVDLGDRENEVRSADDVETMSESNRPTSVIRSGAGISRTVPDSFAPQPFTGTNMDADAWLAYFQRYTGYRQLSENDVTAILPLFLKDVAIDWYENLPANVKQDHEALINNFKTYFGKSPLDYVFDEESIFSRTQRATEKVRDYVAQMQKLAKRIPRLDDDLLMWVIVKGLRPFIKASVIQHKAEMTTLADLLQHAQLAESAGAGTTNDNCDDTQIRQLRNEVRAGREEVEQLNAEMTRMTLSAVQQRSPTPTRRPQHVSFRRDGAWKEQRSNGPNRETASFVRGSRRGQYRPYNNNNRFTQPSGYGPGTMPQVCSQCGKCHTDNRPCPATRLSCFNCGRVGHLGARCFMGRRTVRNTEELAPAQGCVNKLGQT